MRLFFLKQGSVYIRPVFKNKIFFSLSTEFYFSVVSIPALKCTFNMLSNVFPSLCYTRDMSYSFLLCVFGWFPSPEMLYPSSPDHLKSYPCLRSESQYHLAMLAFPTPSLTGGYPLFFGNPYNVVEHTMLTSSHLMNSNLFAVSLHEPCIKYSNIGTREVRGAWQWAK